MAPCSRSQPAAPPRRAGTAQQDLETELSFCPCGNGQHRTQKELQRNPFASCFSPKPTFPAGVVQFRVQCPHLSTETPGSPDCWGLSCPSAPLTRAFHVTSMIPSHPYQLLFNSNRFPGEFLKYKSLTEKKITSTCPHLSCCCSTLGAQ